MKGIGVIKAMNLKPQAGFAAWGLMPCLQRLHHRSSLEVPQVYAPGESRQLFQGSLQIPYEPQSKQTP